MKRWVIHVGSLPVTVVIEGGWTHLIAEAAAFCRATQEVGEIATRAGLAPLLVAGIKLMLPKRPPAKEWEKTLGPVTARLGPEVASISFVMPESKVEEVFLLPYNAQAMP